MHSELMTVQAVGFLRWNLGNALDSSLGNQYSLGPQAWIQYRLGSSWSSKQQATMGIRTT